MKAEKKIKIQMKQKQKQKNQLNIIVELNADPLKDEKNLAHHETANLIIYPIVSFIYFFLMCELFFVAIIIIVRVSMCMCMCVCGIIVHVFESGLKINLSINVSVAVTKTKCIDKSGTETRIAIHLLKSRVIYFSRTRIFQVSEKCER